jgi:hypothetical protein
LQDGAADFQRESQQAMQTIFPLSITDINRS